MATAGAPRAAALGYGLALALITATLAGGCGESDSATATATATTPSASAAATPPEELCTRIVAHWSRTVLDENTYGDYQTMGLSNGQYAILRHVVDAARAARKHQGAAAADELIDREAREGCAARYRSGSPADGPWQ